jgi:dienelactone hydrolase
LEFEGSYPVVGGRFREKLTLELVERRRNGGFSAWLAAPDLREAALAALTVSDALPVDPASLYSLLDGTGPIVQRKVLALAYRRRLPPPPMAHLVRLFRSRDARLRALALRVLEEVEKEAARPLIDQGLADDDYFVREAALAWVRDRLPPRRALTVQTPGDARAAWNELGVVPRAPPSDPTRVEIAQTLGTGAALPAESCGEVEDWTARVIRSRRRPQEVLGTTLRAMATSPYFGWPYIVHVPQDYRGDEPMPLLIFLSGDSGRTMHGVGYSRETLSGLGYLTAKATALRDEILRNFNVDTNRVYLVGSSNGGTGTVRFSTWWTDRLAASVSMMGAGRYTADGAEPPLVVNLLRLPLLLLHGEEDRTIRLQSDKELLNAIRRLNPEAPVRLHAFKGRGHDIIFDTDEGLTQPFLQQHQRKPFPRQVAFQAEDLRFPRRFWLEILDKQEGLAEMQGRIEEDNTVRVDTHGVKRLRLLLRPELLPRSGRARVILNGSEVFSGNLPESCSLLQKSWPFLAYAAQLVFDVTR